MIRQKPVIPTIVRPLLIEGRRANQGDGRGKPAVYTGVDFLFFRVFSSENPQRWPSVSNYSRSDLIAGFAPELMAISAIRERHPAGIFNVAAEYSSSQVSPDSSTRFFISTSRLHVARSRQKSIGDVVVPTIAVILRQSRTGSMLYRLTTATVLSSQTPASVRR